MPKMIVSIDDVVIKEVQITKDRTTLGRRPYNDVVIDNLAVSGEHAVLLMSGSEVTLEDVGSTNGSYVNGKAIKKQLLKNGDAIEIGKYKIKFVDDKSADPVDTAIGTSPLPAASTYTATLSETGSVVAACIKVLNGAAAGREVPLTKVVTTIGKPAVAVAAITRRPQGYVVHHVEGGGNPKLNGTPISFEPVALKDGDVIELAGTRMQFVQA